MTHDELSQAATSSLEDRVRDAIKGVLEQVTEEEMTAQLQAKHRERTERRLGERNGHYGRALTTAAGHIEQVRVPRAREVPFLTGVFERYRRMTGSLEEAILEMYLQRVSTRKVEEITGKLSGARISKDAVRGRRVAHRIAARFDDVFAEWRTRQLDRERTDPYLYLDATHGRTRSPLKARWAGAVRDVALLVAVGVSDEGFREVLAVEAAAGERSETWRGPLKGLVECSLRGVWLIISDGHDAIKEAVWMELPGAAWQRCVVHFERNILAHVPQAETKVVAADLAPRGRRKGHLPGGASGDGRGAGVVRRARR